MIEAPHVLEATTWIPVRREDAFSFFATAQNLERITPPELRLKILTPTPFEMQEGSLIDYRLRLWGVPIRWKTRIEVWEPCERFVSVQLAGPYRSWVHTHEFEDLGSATSIHDRVEYTLPLWPFGELVLPLVRSQLERIFRYRTMRLVKMFAGGKRPGETPATRNG